MDTIELTLSVPPVEHDRYIAWLEDLATGFVQDDSELRAYVPAGRWAPEFHEQLAARLGADGYSDVLSVRPLASKNWNAVWEDSLSPVRAGPFLICPASVNVPPEHTDAQVLRIDPKMSFGTGHHATTRLALQLLSDALAPDDRVLDVGTGTGVLAIAACQSGAALSYGVDTNPDAVRNARENATKNESSDCVIVREGSLDVVPASYFDVVVANITRRVLLDLLPEFVAHLTARGTLLLSGILDGEHSEVVEAASTWDLLLREEVAENGWWGGRFSFSQ